MHKVDNAFQDIEIRDCPSGVNGLFRQEIVHVNQLGLHLCLCEGIVLYCLIKIKNAYMKK